MICVKNARSLVVATSPQKPKIPGSNPAASYA